MRHPRLRHWVGPAAGSLLAHGVGVALGVRLLSGDLAGDLTGADRIPVREPVTLRITAAPIAHEPMEAEPPMPEQPEPEKPEPVVVMQEPPRPPEPPKEEVPPDEPEPMVEEASVAENLPPALPKPVAAAPEPDAAKPARPATKARPISNPPAAKPVPPQAAPGRAAQRAPGAMRLCTPADYLRRSAIRYPDETRSRGWQGQVVLVVLLDADGRPTSVDVARSSGHGMLDEAARRAVEGWRFRPERVGGNAVPSRVLVPVRFALD